MKCFAFPCGAKDCAGKVDVVLFGYKDEQDGMHIKVLGVCNACGKRNMADIADLITVCMMHKEQENEKLLLAGTEVKGNGNEPKGN